MQQLTIVRLLQDFLRDLFRSGYAANFLKTHCACYN
jgi:hypothetical protein